MSAVLALTALLLAGGDDPLEADHYTIETLAPPPGVELEVGGLALLPDGRALVCTRRGYLYAVEGVDGPAEDVRFVEVAQGLQEPLGLLVHDGAVYCVQRGELSRLHGLFDGGPVEAVETVADGWTISGNYHEYNFGPRLGPDGRLWITTNKPFGGEPFGRVDWRGYALSFDLATGAMTPVACGLRSPAGIETAPWGDVFYTDNQGEWCGASKLSLLRPGSFHGHPWGVFSTTRDEWPYAPVDADGVPDGMLMPEFAAREERFELPAVWFPYEKTGKSPAGMVWDRSGGAFGPFEGQLFVGDQHHAWLLRVTLEEVDGHWQGAVYRFRDELRSGITRVTQTPRGDLLVGMTNRGWGSRGRGEWGLQRVRWTGRVPFELHALRAVPGGFALDLTAPADPATVVPASFRLESYTYELHAAYGSAEMDRAEPTVTAARLSADGRTVHLDVDGLRPGYVHELHADGLRAADARPLLHPEAYYTLVRLPR